jgi:hypothetical protein
MRPTKKITKAKRAGNIALVEEHLPSKYEALSSNPTTTKKRRGVTMLGALKERIA